MIKTRVSSDRVTEAAPGLWSNCLSVGPVVYIAGLTAREPNGAPNARDEYGQAKIIFQKINDLITAAGGMIDDVVKLTIFVTNIGQREGVWRARKEFFSGDFPTCSLVEVRSLATPEILVEIEGVAYIGCSNPTS